jgi:DNA-binding response OmpR family regulator
MKKPTGLRLLLVEDQRDIAQNIWDFLERRGHQMDHAVDGASGLQFALNGDYDLIILDLGLPRLDGLDLCAQLRRAGRDLPVLMLTARDTLDDKLRGFDRGADDYLVKPFALPELDARIRALHRRHRGSPAVTLKVGPLEYDPGNLVAHRAGTAARLTRSTGALLAELMRRAPNVVSHEDLMRVLPAGTFGDIRTLHTHIHSLRIAIEKPFDRTLIHSVHGMGYRIEDQADA